MDSKSTAGDSVPVRVRSPAPKIWDTPWGIPYFLRRRPPARIEGESPAASPSAAGGGRSEGAVCAAVYIFKAAATAAENIGHRKRTPTPFPLIKTIVSVRGMFLLIVLVYRTYPMLS